VISRYNLAYAQISGNTFILEQTYLFAGLPEKTTIPNDSGGLFLLMHSSCVSGTATKTTCIFNTGIF
jgi:hypothetical protein